MSQGDVFDHANNCVSAAVRSAIRSVLLVCMSALSAGTHGKERFLSCSDREVRYSVPTAVPLDKRVVVRRLQARTSDVQREVDPAFEPYSPQRTAAFNRIHIADTTKRGPYVNSVEIFKLSGKSEAWRIDVVDLVGNVSLQWLNEDLVFMRVWWGSIVSTDLIFQLSSGTFIYAQEANYGTLVQPCN